METINQRIRIIKDHYYGTKRGSRLAFAQKMGEDGNKVGGWMKPDYPVGAEVINKILTNFEEIEYDWLVNGEGNMLKDSETNYNELTPVPEKDYMMAEFADLRSNGGRLGGGDTSILPDTRKRLVPREYEKGNYLVVRVSGNSMYDGTARSLTDGDEILVRELEPDEWNNLPILTRLFVITSREGNVVKQIKEVSPEKGYVLCHSFNSEFKDFKIMIADIYQIFVVYKIVQKQITLI